MNPDRAAIAIVGLMGVAMVALGLCIVTLGYGMAASAVASAKLLSQRGHPVELTLVGAWQPTAVTGGVLALLGCVWIAARRWITATCIAPRVSGTTSEQGDSVFIAIIVALGVLLMVASSSGLAVIAVTSAVNGLGEVTEGIVWASVVLVWGAVLALRPRWLSRFANGRQR